MPNGVVIKTLEQFKKLSPEQQREVFFETLVDIKEQTCGQIKACDERFKKIEGRKWVHATWSALGGIIGGAAAVFTKMAIWK